MHRQKKRDEWARLNKYDQVTNLAIDLENEINRSVVFPRIVSRIVEIEAQNLVARRRVEEEQRLNSLQGEIERLRRQVLRMDERRFLAERVSTEVNEKIYQGPKLAHLGTEYRQILSHHFSSQEK